jgi:hypothetical protein
MRSTTATTSHTFELKPDQLLSLDAPHGCIHLAHGQVWLTERGARQDAVLGAGDHWLLQGEPVLLSALAPTRLHLVGATCTPLRILSTRWHHLVRATRNQVQRLQFGPSEVQAWR